MKTISILGAILIGAVSVNASVLTYTPIRDTYMRGGPTDLHGSSPNGRASKALLDFYISDYDRFAILSAIELELGHPLTFEDMADIDLSLNLFSNDGQGYQPTALSRPAVFQGTQMWIEGDNSSFGATKTYALYDPNFPENSLEWKDTSGNPVAGFLNLPRVENAVFEEWGGEPFTYREWVLDDVVAYTYLVDSLSLGLFLSASDGPNVGGELAQYNNTEVYSREVPDTSRQPFLKVTVIPEPVSIVLFGISTLLLVGSRRRRMFR